MLTKLGGKATSMPSSAMAVSKKDAEQDFELSLAGMEVLVTILKAFLRALGLPGGDEGSDDSAGARIRGMLQLDVGLAAIADEHGKGGDGAPSTDVSVVSSDFSGSELGKGGTHGEALEREHPQQEHRKHYLANPAEQRVGRIAIPC